MRAGQLRVLLGALLALVLGCHETSEEAFSSLANPQAQELLARGWIPSELPAGSTEVRVRWDLDTNMVRGCAKLSPADLRSLLPKLRRLSDTDRPPYWMRWSMTPMWWPPELTPPGTAIEMRNKGWELFQTSGRDPTFMAIRWSEGRVLFWSESG